MLYILHFFVAIYYLGVSQQQCTGVQKPPAETEMDKFL